MAAGSGSKKRKLDEESKEDSESDSMNVILALFGSFNPVTFLHLRTFGMCHVSNNNNNIIYIIISDRIIG